jgi:hypothetical protein
MITGRRILTVFLITIAVVVSSGDPRDLSTITIPVWLLCLLLGATITTVLGLFWAWHRAENLVDQILDEELHHPQFNNQQDNANTKGGKHR